MGGTFTSNGTGTILYGKKDELDDGSYITTEWIVFFWVPLYPLRSWRILPTGEGANNIVYSSYGYKRAQVPLDAHQVRNGYAVTLGIIAVVTALSIWG